MTRKLSIEVDFRKTTPSYVLDDVVAEIEYSGFGQDGTVVSFDYTEGQKGVLVKVEDLPDDFLISKELLALRREPIFAKARVSLDFTREPDAVES